MQVALIHLSRHWRRAQEAAEFDAFVRRVPVNVLLEDRRQWWSRRVDAVAAVERAAGDASSDTDRRTDIMAALARISPGQIADGACSASVTPPGALTRAELDTLASRTCVPPGSRKDHCRSSLATYQGPPLAHRAGYY